MSNDTQVGTWLKRQWHIARGRVRTSWRPHQLYLFDRMASLHSVDAAVSAFGQWCEAHQGEVCAIGLSGRWLLSSVSQIDADHSAAYGHAVQQWSHYLDIDEAALASDWVLRQLALPHMSLLCAAPKPLIDGLREQAAMHDVRLEWVGPWWTRCMQAWLASLNQGDEVSPAHPELWLSEPGLLTHARAHLHDLHGALLSEVWTEVTTEVSATHQGQRQVDQPATVSVRLPLTTQVDTALQPWLTHVWDHPELSALLRGDATVWQAST